MFFLIIVIMITIIIIIIIIWDIVVVAGPRQKSRICRVYIYICISLYTNTLSLHSHAMSCFDRQRLSLNVSGVAGAGAGDVAQFLGGTQGPCHSLLAQSLGPWGCGLDILGPLGLGRPRIYWEYNGFPLVGGVSRGGFLWRNMR